MSEPTSSLSFFYMITKIAQEAGIASYGPSTEDRALPPTDYGDLARCKDVVNAGIRSFIADCPPTGWRWMQRIMSVAFARAYTGVAETTGTDATHLTDDDIAGDYADDFFNTFTLIITSGTGEGETATVTDYDGTAGQFEFTGGLSGSSTPDNTSQYVICRSTDVIDGDPARYYLAENFGGDVSGPIEYAARTGHGIHIEWRDESVIRALRASSVSTGYPSLAAIRRLEPTADGAETTRRYELIVDPQPSADDTVEFPYTLMFDKLDMETGITDSAGIATLVDATRLESLNYFKDWKIEIVSGTGKGSNALVTGYAVDGTFTVAEWLTAAGATGGTTPGADSIYIVQPVRNLHPAGGRFDQAIMTACLSEAEMIFEDIAVNYTDKYLKKDLPQAYKIDARSAPRKLGNLNRKEVRYRTWNDVTYN